ncbi:hypothetical protein ACIBQ3_03505 [Streptomyces rubiginosohelvolus]|uniref:hypothetical protein n=1 Tax=Streptomyces rubiginosohelvolus TaxID=67362 RepID=UPI0037B94ABB
MIARPWTSARSRSRSGPGCCGRAVCWWRRPNPTARVPERVSRPSSGRPASRGGEVPVYVYGRPVAAVDRIARLAEAGVAFTGRSGRRTGQLGGGVPAARRPPAGAGGGLQRFGVDPERLSLVVQTGIPVDDAVGMITALRDRYPRVRGQHYDALCYAATDRAAAVRSVAGAVDLTLVLGAADDPDAGHLEAEAAAGGRAVRRLAAADDLAAAWLTGVNAIGVVPARSAPGALMPQLLDALAGLGPLSVTEREVRTAPRPAVDGAAPGFPAQTGGTVVDA